MSLTVTTDQDLLDSGIIIRKEFQRLTDKGHWPGATGALHAKAKAKVVAWLRDRPERVEETDLTNLTQFKDAQLQYVLYLLYRRAGETGVTAAQARAGGKSKADRAYAFFVEEMSLVEPEILGTESRDTYIAGIIFERG